MELENSCNDHRCGAGEELLLQPSGIPQATSSSVRLAGFPAENAPASLLPPSWWRQPTSTMMEVRLHGRARLDEKSRASRSPCHLPSSPAWRTAALAAVRDERTLMFLNGTNRRVLLSSPRWGPDLSQDLGEQPPRVLAVGELVKAKTQREERMACQQLGDLLTYTSRIWGPTHRSREQTSQLGKLNLGQSTTGQSLCAEPETELTSRARGS